MTIKLYELILFRSIKTILLSGVSPKKLMHILFDFIDGVLETMNNGKTKSILYNRINGFFEYSDEFIDFVNSNINDITDSREMYGFIEEFAEKHSISIEEALERAAGENCEFGVKTIPCHRSYSIESHHGRETVVVRKNFCF